MKKSKVIMLACMASLIAACSQKQSVVQVPVSTIDAEKLRDSIDYNMDVSGLNLSDLRILRNAPAAQRGYPFKDSYLRGIYGVTSWYDSLMYVLDEKVQNVDTKEGENWRDAYLRTIDEQKLIVYNDEEMQFMKRLKEREDELQKQNFEVGEGLRVNMSNLLNPQQLKDFDSTLCQKLAEEGFAIVPSNTAQLFHIYERNDYSDFPNFVTTDLYLQLYHLYIDCMLRELEEYQLLPLMTSYSQDMIDAMLAIIHNAGNDDSETKRIAGRNLQFFRVALHLFNGKPIDASYTTEKAEIERCLKAKNERSSMLMDYMGEVSFPYSLFRARGHYTRSDALKRYFRGMMWLQTATMGMDHATEVKQAVQMAFAMKLFKNTRQKYDKINNLITMLMGQHDNLSLIQVMSEVDKTGMAMEELLNDDKEMAKLTKVLNEIGDKQTRIRPKFEKTSHNKINVMPQRYQPDAEVLQEMVDYDSRITQRGVPKGIDVMAAMGVSAAEQILKEEKTEWKKLLPTLDRMKKRMGEIDWQETTATQWMQTLKVLTTGTDSQSPYFMQNPNWSKKDLNAALASWAELKHDAILYAKQPMGAECGGGESVPDPVVKGYVEPNVKFWKKASELLENTAKLLKDQNMMTEKIEGVTERLREEVTFLLRVSEKELAGKVLTDEEYDQISYIGATFENISLDLLRMPDQNLYNWVDIEGADRKVALVADVYTANADNNPDKAILFEAVGDADEIYVVVEIGGYLYLTRGAVLSYREFVQPIDQPRLTDEEWQKQLESNPRKGVPDWMKPILLPLKKMPEPNEEVFYSSGC
ncbi:DUF3160 domain-containing protein [Xylanibacter ruminicola]|uniref:YARHG domain-containing protein n=1 Tax=Xylanibacter ruminicola TaxID=839 RepID=A0A1M6TX13_XYLRU|nr:DUF3160 domain-containing protein [Xylanibacter ruminicola]SHK61479.1 YARHG domain-containing protein [Xylanibacter ruminicola]